LFIYSKAFETDLFSDVVKLLLDTVGQFENDSRTNNEFFISLVPDVIASSYFGIITILTNARDILSQSLSPKYTRKVGLYLAILTDDYQIQLEAVNIVFGDKNSSQFRIGHILNCDRVFNNIKALNYLRRLDFITCTLSNNEGGPPEELVNNVVTICNNYSKAATNLKITANIMCAVEYASFGKERVTEDFARVRFQLDFLRFWCSLVKETSSASLRIRFVMKSVVDNEFYQRFLLVKHISWGFYHQGWWRRTRFMSTEPGAFVEKIDETPIRLISGKCAKLCEPCISSERCCIGTCEVDINVAVQFLNSSHEPPTICRQNQTLCQANLGGDAPGTLYETLEFEVMHN